MIRRPPRSTLFPYTTALPIFRPRNLPGISVPQPVIRRLGLLTIDDPLPEDAVFVADAVAVERQAQCGRGIEKTGREPPQSAVAEARVVLAFGEALEIEPDLLHRLVVVAVRAEVDDAADQQPSEKELEREVVDALHVAPV